MKVFDSINPREGICIGDADRAEVALAMLRAHYEGTGEDRLYGVTTADCDQYFEGEVFVPQLHGIN